jgi:hypothetical protein
MEMKNSKKHKLEQKVDSILKLMTLEENWTNNIK